MELHEAEITGAKAFLLDWKPTIIIPIGDVQLGSDGVDIRLLRDKLEQAKRFQDDGHTVRFFGMGDYLDLLSPSNRKAWKSSALYDSAMSAMDDKAATYEQAFIDLMRDTKGMWLGMLHGHHYFEHEDGTTSDTRICQALEAPYLGSCGMVRLSFKPAISARRRVNARRCGGWQVVRTTSSCDALR